MFCYHCQEAKKNVACDTAGICGKKANVSSLQDLLMFSLKGMAYYCARADRYKLVTPAHNRFMAKALFSMVTNVNFDPADFVALIDEAVKRRNSVRAQFLVAFQTENGAAFSETLPPEASWQPEKSDEKSLTDFGATVGVKKDLETLDADVHALQECLLYAAKGLGSLAVHNQELRIEDEALYRFLHQALDITLKADNTLEDIMKWALESGQLGLAAMAQFEQANADKFGDPETTTVHLDALDRPGILVSGHDLQDLEDLLEQTAGSNIDIYTHGETIAAHAYPALKKYFNLVANFGGAWQDQKTEFPKFNGPILVTTNSIQQPKKTYQEKLFSTGMVGWPDVPHIADRKPGQRKDFSALIEVAKQQEAPGVSGTGTFTTGYGRQVLSSLADAIANELGEGRIQRIIVLAGTDGRHKERRYYTELAQTLPQDTLILTCGDLKFRFLDHDFGMIGDIPRLLDAGQINAIDSIIQCLQQIRQRMGLDALNQLPVSFNLAWFEQKTILAMLALMALDCKNIRVGPTLPPFFSEKIQTVLSESYQLKGIDTVENDVAAMLAGN